MTSFDINTRPEMFVPLIHCVGDTLSQAMPDLQEALLQFIIIIIIIIIYFKSGSKAHKNNGHTDRNTHRRHEFDECCTRFHPKEDTFAFNTTQEYTNNRVYLVNFVNN